MNPNHAKSEARSLQVQGWAAEYHRRLGLTVGVEVLLARALKVAGSHAGLTRTKVRKAARELRG